MALRYLCALPTGDQTPLEWRGCRTDAGGVVGKKKKEKSPNSSFYDEPGSKSATGVIHPVFADEK